MAYPYVCDFCMKNECKNCEQSRDIPEDPEAMGGGFCACSHREEKALFELELRGEL